MALGELYSPSGKALETAQQVLQVNSPMACNVAMGCTNLCKFCYGDTSNRQWNNQKGVRLPKISPVDLVTRQLEDGLKPEGVFLSFMTDPFISENAENTLRLIRMLILKGIPVATLSKVAYSSFGHKNLQTGMTIVSDNDLFSKRYEPKAEDISTRIKMLRSVHENGYPCWASMEPYPTPALWKQNIQSVLEKIDFVDFIIYGKWNYEPLAQDKEFYRKSVKDFERFCEEKGIRHYVKSETRRYIQ